MIKRFNQFLNENINAENLPDDLIVKFSNLWFNTDKPITEPKDFDRRYVNDIIKHILYGDEQIFAHERINDLLNVLKDYGILEWEKTPMELFYKGKIRAMMKISDTFNNPMIKAQFQGILNVIGDLANKYKKEIQDEEKEKGEKMITSFLAHKNINRN
jgi:hypothetical protein